MRKKSSTMRKEIAPSLFSYSGLVTARCGSSLYFWRLVFCWWLLATAGTVHGWTRHLSLIHRHDGYISRPLVVDRVGEVVLLQQKQRRRSPSSGWTPFDHQRHVKAKTMRMMSSPAENDVDPSTETKQLSSLEGAALLLQNIDSLLHRAEAFLEPRTGETNLGWFASSSPSWSSSLWLSDQIQSLYPYLLQVQEDTTAIIQQMGTIRGTALDKAREMDAAILQGTIPLDQLRDMALEFQQLREWESTRDHRFAMMNLVDRQLAAWEELVALMGKDTMPATSSSTTPLPTREKSKEWKGSPIPFFAATRPTQDGDRRPGTALKATNRDQSEEIGLEYLTDPNTPDSDLEEGDPDEVEDLMVDVAIIGAGLGGLCAGAILNTLYGQKVAIYESHYLPGGCAHAFDRRMPGVANLTFTFDSGPSILLACSSPPYNALRQILDAVGQTVDWISYDGWGMIERPGQADELRWRVELGPGRFEEGPLRMFGGDEAVLEYKELQRLTQGLLAGARIPAMAMRGGPTALVPLLRYFPTLMGLIQQGNLTTSTFAPFMDGPIFRVTNPWLRNWLDALAFSLSGLPASRTAAAAMAFVVNDMHRTGAALDYPRGGMGEIVAALVRAVEQGPAGSRVYVRKHVESIDCSAEGTEITGVSLRGGPRIVARKGVICNAPVWSLNGLIKDERVRTILNNKIPFAPSVKRASWLSTGEGSSIKLVRSGESKEANGLLFECDQSEMTGSFLHLHLAMNASGLDLNSLEAHYTVMDRSLAGDGRVVNGIPDGPCGELNMIAVSNPCVLDRTLAPEGYILIHAYGAGNEPYEIWEGLSRRSPEYARRKAERSAVLWRAVESVIPDVRDRVVFSLVGSPLTHERFLRRPRGTYGSATEDYLKDGTTPFDSLVLASDSIFPGIGVPSVAIVGASAANTIMTVFQHWLCLDSLKAKGSI